jgi:hypothetical protein
MIGTRRMRPRVMMFGILVGMLTRRFPASGFILRKIRPFEGCTDRYLHSIWQSRLRAIAWRRNPT